MKTEFKYQCPKCGKTVIMMVPTKKVTCKCGKVMVKIGK